MSPTAQAIEPETESPSQEAQRSLSRFLGFVVLLLCALVPCSSALAQDASSAKKSRDGLYAGQFQLRPGLFLEGGYNSNLFREDADEKVTGAAKLNGRLQLGVETPNPKSLALKFNLGLVYSEYLSELERVSNQSGLAANGTLRLTFNPNGAIALAVYDNFKRTNDAPSSESFDSFNQLNNQVGANLIIQPGGKLLTLELGGSYTAFQSPLVEDVNHQRLGLDAEGTWKFLPKTSLKVLASHQFVSYDEQFKEPLVETPAFLDPVLDSSASENVESSPLRVEGGLNGLLTRRVSVTLMGGYGDGNYNSGPNFAGFIGRAEVGYEIDPSSRFRLGYKRNFEDSSFANYIQFHKATLSYNQKVADLVDLKLEGEFRYQEFANNPSPILPTVSTCPPDGGECTPGARVFSTDDRVDLLYRLNAGAMFHLFGVWRLGANYKLSVNDTDFLMITGIQAEMPDQDDINTKGITVASFVQHQFVLSTGVEW